MRRTTAYGWTWNYCGFGGVITAPDGRSVWLQGDEAAALDDEIDACETDEQVYNALSAYDDVCKHENAD